MKLLLAPHSDDESLFCAYTILRAKPDVLVVTDNDRHTYEGSDTRRQESENAMILLGADVKFLGIPESELTYDRLRESIHEMYPDVVFAPALQGGNKDHDIVSQVATDLWGEKVVYYATYTKDCLTPSGDLAIHPTRVEKDIKNAALAQYLSQLERNKPHFDAVYNQPEYFIW